MSPRDLPRDSRCGLPASHRERFIRRIRVSPSGCWLWRGTRAGFGHGRFKVQGAYVYTHRIAYRLWVGPIPRGACVLHDCDVPQCVNPAHLHLGTRAQNNAERDGRGRTAHGTQCRRALLTPSLVRSLRARARSGEPYTQIAAGLGVTAEGVRRAALGLTWARVVAAPATLQSTKSTTSPATGGAA